MYYLDGTRVDRVFFFFGGGGVQLDSVPVLLLPRAHSFVGGGSPSSRRPAEAIDCAGALMKTVARQRERSERAAARRPPNERTRRGRRRPRLRPALAEIMKSQKASRGRDAEFITGGGGGGGAQGAALDAASDADPAGPSIQRGPVQK